MNTHSKLSVTVIIPTYLRPEYLVNCLDGLLKQTRLPEQVLVVIRDIDEATHLAFQTFLENLSGIPVSIGSAIVIEPGFLPPLVTGISHARGDIVAFLDDDAEPFPDWLERLERHYSDSSVGGVGGRCINMNGSREVSYPVARNVGRFSWFGRVVGNMYRETASELPRRVDFFMGGNMSYRRRLLEQVKIDSALNNNVAFHHEVDLGLQIKALGFTLIFDPRARIKHFSAPRPQGGLRTRSKESIYWYSHNLLYITLKHVSWWKRPAAIAYGFLIGDRMGWGVVSAFVDTLQNRRLTWVREIVPSFAGKIRAVLAFLY